MPETKEITVKPAIRRKVHTRAKLEKCLIDGCDKDARRRGLCGKHHMAYLRALVAHHKSERKAFADRAIREGLILAAGEIREIKSTSPFADL